MIDAYDDSDDAGQFVLTPGLAGKILEQQTAKLDDSVNQKKIRKHRDAFGAFIDNELYVDRYDKTQKVDDEIKQILLEGFDRMIDYLDKSRLQNADGTRRFPEIADPGDDVRRQLMACSLIKHAPSPDPGIPANDLLNALISKVLPASRDIGITFGHIRPSALLTR